MNRPARRRLSFAFCLSLIFPAATMTATAQYYPLPYHPVLKLQQLENSLQPSSPPASPRSSGNAFSLSPYLMFNAGHYSGVGVGNGTAATQSGGMTALGGTFGGYALYPSSGPVHLGIDARLIVDNSSNSTTYGNKILGGLVGLRIDDSDSQLPVVPYFQFEIGGVGTNNGTSTSRTGSFAYQVQLGADVPFANPQFAARVEYGTGQLTGINHTNHTLQTFSIGVVFHLQ